MARSPFWFVLLGVLSFLSNPTIAFSDIEVPYIITADTDFKVTITNDLKRGSRSFDAKFTLYRVYLATTPPGWGTGPVCILANDTKIDVESLTLQIPASVGPRGTYSLATHEYNEDPRKSSSGFQYSNDFDLKGGSGEWGVSELNGRGIGNANTIPCTAYACAKKCNDDNYMDYTAKDSKKAFGAYKKGYKCLLACPGVTAPPWRYADDVDDFPRFDEEEDLDDEDIDDEDVISSTRSSSITQTVTRPPQTASTSTLAISTSNSASLPTTASTSASTPSTIRSASVTGAGSPAPTNGAGRHIAIPLTLIFVVVGSNVATFFF